MALSVEELVNKKLSGVTTSSLPTPTLDLHGKGVGSRTLSAYH